MEKRKRILVVGFLVSFILASLFASLAGASPRVYYGQVVGIEFSLLRYPTLPIPAHRPLPAGGQGGR